jgi:hypothetical protein
MDGLVKWVMCKCDRSILLPLEVADYSLQDGYDCKVAGGKPESLAFQFGHHEVVQLLWKQKLWI